MDVCKWILVELLVYVVPLDVLKVKTLQFHEARLLIAEKYYYSSRFKSDDINKNHFRILHKMDTRTYATTSNTDYPALVWQLEFVLFFSKLNLTNFDRT